MAFNLKRSMTKTASEESPQSREGALNAYNKEWGNTTDTASPHPNGQLDAVRGEGSGQPDQTTEQQLNKPRKEALDNQGVTTEAQIDKRKGWFPHRSAEDHFDHATMTPINASGLANDERFHKAYMDAVEVKGKRLVDKDPGSQLSNEKTTISRQVPTSGSQLNNTPDRFKDLNDSLKEADSALFGVYYKAASENREVNETEKKIIAQISDHKKTILSQFGGLSPIHPPHLNDPMGLPSVPPVVDPSNDPNHPHGHPESQFYPDNPTQKAHNLTPKTDAEPNDDEIIQHLLGENPPGGVGGEDIKNPDFQHLHGQEQQDNKINTEEDHGLF